ncbi:MAG TPA: hypothetical protein VFR31_11280 [Thermoanaerobaculia bacterium]|nr:hypothetical protein [Thermoanaerobaculia bacterium]
MQRTVSGLWRLERAVPPPGLSTRVRAEVAAMRRPEPTYPRGVVSYLYGLPNRPVLRTAAAMALPLVLTFFLFANGMEKKAIEARVQPLHTPVEVVTVAPLADMPLVMPLTTSKVAGREFVWRELGNGDSDVWVQRGLEGEVPAARVSAQSPQGRELLAQHSELSLLLADGATVVLRYRLETVELSKGV